MLKIISYYVNSRRNNACQPPVSAEFLNGLILNAINFSTTIDFKNYAIETMVLCCRENLSRQVRSILTINYYAGFGRVWVSSIQLLFRDGLFSVSTSIFQRYFWRFNFPPLRRKQNRKEYVGNKPAVLVTIKINNLPTNVDN